MTKAVRNAFMRLNLAHAELSVKQAELRLAISEEIKSGLTARDLAHDCDVSEAFMCDLRKGRREFGAPTVQLICKKWTKGKRNYRSRLTEKEQDEAQYRREMLADMYAGASD